LNPLAKKLYGKHLLMGRWLIGKYYLTVIERYTIRQIHGDYSTPNLQTSIKLELSRRKDSLVSTSSSFFFYFSWQLYGNLWLIFWLILQLVFSVRLTNDWTLRPFQSSFFQFNTVKKENGENKKKFIIPMTLTYIIFKEFFGLCCFLSLLC